MFFIRVAPLRCFQRTQRDFINLDYGLIDRPIFSHRELLRVIHYAERLNEHNNKNTDQMGNLTCLPSHGVTLFFIVLSNYLMAIIHILFHLSLAIPLKICFWYNDYAKKSCNRICKLFLSRPYNNNSTKKKWRTHL